MSKDLCAMEQRFWSHVWRCAHRIPCRRCCWPWMGRDGLYYRVDSVYTFCSPLFSRSMTVYRVSYLLGRGTLLLPWGRTIHLCHQCDYRRCCNNAHIFPGSSSDNGRDRRGQPRDAERQPVRLPDGQWLTSSNSPLRGPIWIAH